MELISFGGMFTTPDGAARLAQLGVVMLDAELVARGAQGGAACLAAYSFLNACAHEAGHVVAQAAHGRTLKVARVFERKMTLPISGRKVRGWGGWTESMDGDEVFRTADDVERHARITIAGYVGEALLRGGERLCGSSLDERAAFVHLGGQAAGMRNVEPVSHTAWLLSEVYALLEAEGEMHRVIYEALRNTRELRSKAIERLVAGARQIGR